jgi:hypothetical protein
MGDETPMPLRDEVIRQLERTKWFLWHGNVFRALQVLTTILFDLEMAAGEHEEGKSGKLWQVVQEFYTLYRVTVIMRQQFADKGSFLGSRNTRLGGAVTTPMRKVAAYRDTPVKLPRIDLQLAPLIPPTFHKT